VLRALRRRDGISRGERGIVDEEELGEPFLDLQSDGVGEHAEEGVRADAVLEPVEDRAQSEQVGRLHRPEGACRRGPPAARRRR
jgi:hypothetical protein